MQPFVYRNPTRIVFGEGQLARVGELVPAEARVLLCSGSGSIRTNGVHAAVTAQLGARLVGEFAGITPNPVYEDLLPAVARVRDQGITFLLAAGGGSVLDATKFIAAAARFPGDDPWAILADGADIPSAVPLGTILTLPGTGSEMNHWAVISRREPNEKLSFGHPAVAPVFSILDPATTRTLPPRQVANGIIDAFVHVLEQYLTYPVDAPLQDRMAEAILDTLVDEGPATLAHPDRSGPRANLMWSATMALNGLIAAGVPEDWATHTIGHELTALHGLDHAVTLAIVLPALLEHRRVEKFDKLLQYGERIWRITEGSLESRVHETIARTRGFFESLGVATTLAHYGLTPAVGGVIAARLEARGQTALGERGSVTPQVVREILELAA